MPGDDESERIRRLQQAIDDAVVKLVESKARSKLTPLEERAIDRLVAELQEHSRLLGQPKKRDWSGLFGLIAKAIELAFKFFGKGS